MKLLHVTFAVLSISGFLLRGFWAVTGHRNLHHRVTRVAPHVNDTLLLISGVWLAVATGQSPFEHTWLATKLVALLVYIGLGFAALRFARSTPARMAWILAALCVYVYMIAVALGRTPLPGPGLA